MKIGLNNMRLLLYIFLPLLFISSSYAQTTINTKGTDFWLGYMCNVSYLTINLFVQISSDTATTGSVSIPGTGYTGNFSIGANQSIIISFNSTLMNCQEETPFKGGIHIISKAPVSVYAVNNVPETTDGTLVLPTQALGTEYVVSAYSSLQYGLADGFFDTEFLIVATQDSTLIEITPSAVTSNNQLKGTPFLISLNAGETYLVQSPEDITGTLVKSADSLSGCKPFAVFAGNYCTDVPNGNCQSANHLVEQTLPIYQWGNSFLVAPYYSTESYTIRVLAAENNTVVTMNDNSISLNKGQHRDFNYLTGIFCISSNNPIAVMKVLQGADCNGSYSNSGYGDPSLILINPNSQILYKSVFIPTSTTTIFYYLIQVIIKTKFISQLTLDGRSVNNNLNNYTSIYPYLGFNPSSFAAFGCNEYSYVNLFITDTTHSYIIEADSGFIAYSYGYGAADAYSYSLGGSLSGNSSSFIAFQLSDTLVCPNVPVYITDTPNTAITSYKYSFGDGDSSSVKNPVHKYNKPGNYTITLQALLQNGCWNNATTEITVLNIPIANFDVSSNCYGDSTFFINHSATTNTSITSYVWNLGDGTTLKDTSDFYYVYSNLGTYKITLTVTAENGCSDTITKPVTIVECIFIPNIITPNGDKFNDNFVIEGVPLDCNVTIYNRWGGLVFESANYKNDWNGAGLSDGVYYYFVEDSYGNTRKGWVEVIR